MDRRISQRFWEERSAQAGDPRSVTLTGFGARLARLEVGLYQAWMFRQLEELGVGGGSAGEGEGGAGVGRVADLGCGNGDWTVELARRADELLAVDGSAGFVAHCRERLARARVSARVEVRHAELPALELPGRFDLIVFGAVAQYLEDEELERVMARAVAALAPGGALYFRTTVVARGERRERRDPGYCAIYRTAGECRALLERHGLVIRRSALADAAVSDELARRIAGERAWLRPLIGAPARALLGAYRATQRNAVLACVAQR